MYNKGFSLTDISNVVKVTVRGINKIINHYAHHGTLIPFCHGSSEADVVKDDVLHCIQIWKLQRQENYRTDFCLRGYGTEINFHQYPLLIGVSPEY